MKLYRKAAVLLAAALLFPGATCGAEKPKDDTKSIFIDPKVVYRFTVSLLELREDAQHKHLSANEIEIVAKILGTAKYEKKMEHADVARTPYISRYQFTHGYLGGTPRSGETESGMLTIDAKTLYWNEGIYTLKTSEAAKLLEIFPKPVNPRTVSERPEVELNKPNAEQSKDALNSSASR